MADIRVTCHCCGFVALLRPAQVLLPADDHWFSRPADSSRPPLSD